MLMKLDQTDGGVDPREANEWIEALNQVIQTTGLDGAKREPILGKPETQLAPDEKLVRDSVIYGARMSLKWTALVPATMALGYLLLIVYFKARGGYRQIQINPSS